MIEKIKDLFSKMNIKEDGGVFAVKEIFMSTQEVMVASPIGGYKYNECQFVIVPNGDLNAAQTITPLTGDKKWWVLDRRELGLGGTSVVFGSYKVSQEHALIYSRLVKGEYVSEGELQNLADRINKRSKEKSKSLSEKFYKKYGYGYYESSEM